MHWTSVRFSIPHHGRWKFISSLFFLRTKTTRKKKTRPQGYTEGIQESTMRNCGIRGQKWGDLNWPVTSSGATDAFSGHVTASFRCVTLSHVPIISSTHSFGPRGTENQRKRILVCVPDRDLTAQSLLCSLPTNNLKYLKKKVILISSWCPIK